MQAISSSPQVSVGRGFAWLARTSDRLNVVGSLLIGVLTLLVCADVFSRALFRSPIRGVPELAAMAIVAIVYLQMASSLKAGRWATAELLLDRLGARSRLWVEALYALIGAAFFATLCVAVVPFISDAIDSGDYVGVPGMFTFPTWPIKSLVLLGNALCALQFLSSAYLKAHRATRGSVR